MFFKEASSKKSPKPILQLVESKRDGDRIRHQIIISLGRFEIAKEIRRPVAKRVEDVLIGQESFIETSDEIEKVAQQIVHKIRTEGKWTQAKRVSKLSIPDTSVQSVFVDQIQHTDSCELGPELVGQTFWDKLQFSKILTSHGFSDIEIKTTMISILSRLIYPKSENNLKLWATTTALPELLGIQIEQISKNRWYRISDKLMKHQVDIEDQLTQRETDIFQLKRHIFLYDVTNTYFEGAQSENTKAKYSKKSKEKRSDCPQVGIGLVVDEEGFPIRHKTYAGNVHDSVTLVDTVNDLKGSIKGDVQPTVIIDSGMSKDENLQAIQAAGFHYLATEKRTTRNQYSDIFSNIDLFHAIPGRDQKADVQVYKKEHADYVQLFCISEGRKQKETGIRNKAHEKMILDLEKLKKRIEGGKLKDAKKINQAIGRIKERHSRVSRFYDISTQTTKTKTQFLWLRKTDEEGSFDGCYVMKTSRKDLSDNEIWQLYMTLLKVEKGFRSLKSTLGLRPNFHTREDRVDGHILITILAYHILRSIEYTLEQSEDYRAWETIRQLLSTHAYTTMIVPTVAGPVLNIRKAGIPNAEQKIIYRTLDVNCQGLPEKTVAV